MNIFYRLRTMLSRLVVLLALLGLILADWVDEHQHSANSLCCEPTQLHSELELKECRVAALAASREHARGHRRFRPTHKR